MQYGPAATVFTLNLVGVQGRNRPARAAVNWGGGMLIMGGIVNVIKSTSQIMRPDGTAKNSFPSGHTATAFMNATFLHREYGHVNPLYSILGYTMSTYTGISRSLNNRHWLSDILAGAGIGILSADLSYLIVDNLYKNKGDFFSDFKVQTELEKPSFLSIKIGQAFYMDMTSFEKIGLEGALEGAYFFNRRWGLGCEIGFMHIPFEEESLEDISLDQLSPNQIPYLDIQSLGFASFMTNGYYSKFLGSKLIIQGKVSAGLGVGVGGKVNLITKGPGTSQSSTEILLMEYSLNRTCVVGTGVSTTMMVAPSIGLSLYADYKYANPKVNIWYKNRDVSNESSHLSLSSLSCGIRFVSFFSSP